MSSRVGLQKGSDIARRLQAFGADVLSLARRLPPSSELGHVAKQLVRAGTSCGANYEEARGAQSRADFIHKLSIAAKETRETMFWLELLHEHLARDRAPELELELSELDLPATVDEARQLAAILSASIRTARSNARDTS